MEQQDFIDNNSGLSIYDVLGLIVCWSAILVIFFYINSSPGAIISGLIAGCYLSKVIIKNNRNNT